MNILFLSHYFHPSLGGVENHIYNLSKSLIKKGNSVTVITVKFEEKLENKETVDRITIIRFKYPKVKFFGILNIWRFLYTNKKIIEASDIVHIHDVAIWYYPLFLLYPKKLVFYTIHGYEPNNPFSRSSYFQKRLGVRLSNGSIGVGKFLEKYLKIKFDKIIYGAAANQKIQKTKKIKNKVIFLGRLEEDTGLLKYLKRLDEYKTWDVEFVGDGSLRTLCEKYGKVHGFTDPTPFLKKAEYVVPGGYLAYIEAKAYGCKVILYPHSELRKDYWSGIKKIKKFPTWDELADTYLSLWKK